jgi:hypothetical protein
MIPEGRVGSYGWCPRWRTSPGPARGNAGPFEDFVSGGRPVVHSLSPVDPSYGALLPSSWCYTGIISTIQMTSEEIGAAGGEPADHIREPVRVEAEATEPNRERRGRAREVLPSTPGGTE